MKKTSKKHNLTLSVTVSFLLGIATSISYSVVSDTTSWKSFSIKNDNVNICFTPPSGCGLLVAKEISKAKNSIYIQAFGLTSQKIVEQLIKAKHNGVQIRILLDRSNLHNKYSKMQELKRAGIEVSIDKVPGIAHNKVMIIDKSKVITGSFNFTNAADNRNAENVLLINNSDIAESYLQNWRRRAKKHDD